MMKSLRNLMTFSLMLTACDSPPPEPKVEEPSHEEEVGYLEESDLVTYGFAVNSQYPPSEADEALVQRIRQSLISDNTLSYQAKNIEISVRKGIVLLEGKVKSEREKAIISGKIRQMYEVNGIDNRLESLKKEITRVY